MSEKKNKAYNNNSMRALKGPDRIRTRPETILGSNDIKGCQQTFFEILSNSVDEAREGHGKIIKVTRHFNHALTVEDFGRGIPLGFNDNEQRYNWELVYCELYAGGKIDNGEGQNYEFS